MDIDQMVDNIQTYKKLLNDNGFKYNGAGIIPWSHNSIHPPTGVNIDISKSKWVMYAADGDIIDEGATPVELSLSFKLIYG